MPDALLYAEHAPTRHQLVATLQHLHDLRVSVVTALVRLHASRSTRLMDEVAGARGLPAQRMVEEIHAVRDHELSEAQVQLSHIVGILRAAGHRAHGDLLIGPVARTLAQEAMEREPDAVLLLTGHHRMAHWLHRDLERRLKHHTTAPVLAVSNGRLTPSV
jgi:hypothetical protein